MATTKYFDGAAAGGGSGTEGSPYNSLVQAAPGGVFPDEMVLYCKPGTPIPAGTNTAFVTPTDANLTIRPYGAGDGRPEIVFAKNGIGCQGTGSADYRDVNLTGGASGEGNGVLARTGGSVTLVNVGFTNFATAIKCGTGVISLDNVRVYKPARNGLQIDAAETSPICSQLRVLNSEFIAGSPTVQDLLVLHAGGYGLCTDARVENVRITCEDGCYVESGLDIQEQFAGMEASRLEITGVSQWGVVMGSLVKTSRTYSFALKSQMLAAFNRMGSAGGPGTGPEEINGGHCVFVTNDGANNGIWQLTGSDPQNSAAWTGPMTPGDLSALTANKIHHAIFRRCVAGVQIQHPGTQLAACSFIDTTLGNWASIDASGSGNILAIYPMGYDAKVMDCNFSSLNGKYAEVELGPDGVGVPTGQLLTSSRAAVSVKALNSKIAQRTRVTMTGCIVRQRSDHTGPFIELAATADRTYVDTDYCAFVDETAKRSAFASNGGNQTFAQFQASNVSDANSQFLTTAEALIDDDCELLTASPLIGTGIARSGLSVLIANTGLNGVAVSSPPDIGANPVLSEAQADAVVGHARRMLRAQLTQVSGPVDDTPPDDVTGLAAGTPTPVSIAVSWDEADRATSYEIRHARAGTDAWSETTDTALTTSGAATGLDPGYFYDVQVRAHNGAGPSANWSSSVTVMTPSAVWYLPQDGGGDVPDQPALAERYMATGATSNPGAYAAPDFYTLLTDNGGSGGGVSLVAVDDNGVRRIDGVMSMVGMSAGQERLIAIKAAHQQSGVQSFYWDYGAHSSLSSMYGLHVSAAGALTFTSRGKGASSSTNTALTRDSGPVYSDFDDQGEYIIIVSVRSVSATEVDVEVRMHSESVGTSIWTEAAIDCSFGASAATLPGITSGQTAAEHGGLMLGARMKSIASSGEPEKFLGTGASHVAKLGTFQARLHSTYSAAHIGDAINAAASDPDGWWLA